MSTTIVKKKKVLSPFDKLVKRINREFPKKKHIGDIYINDEEYKLLIKYAKISFNNILDKFNHIIIDSIFATALVQIGIRHYDGNYWSNFARELNIIELKSHQQTWVGESFIFTLKSYNKLTLGINQKVNTILMHGFVSDKFSERFFDFIYKYYSIDLERDIERLDAQLMNSLVEVMIRNDNRDRTSMLVSQTADALRVNTIGSKIRIRRWLKLIDKCFWDREIPKNLKNRFNNYFIGWSENSIEFNNDYKYVYNGEATKYRNKSFSFPYLMCNFEDTIFYLVLPKQLIKNEESEDVHWAINIRDEKTILGTELYEAITGYKTEKQQIKIELTYLFEEIIIELRNSDCRIRRFKISQDSIRFFNSEGINIKTDILGEGSMYSFSKKEAITDALIESQSLSGIIFSYYEFQKGDIIKLPDSMPISIGKKIEEGLLQRGLVDSIFVKNEDENIIVYKSSPSVLIRINESKVNGTLININGKTYKLSDIEVNIIDLQDRSDELGYLIKLSEFVNKDGIYEIYIDVPNDRTNRHWKFALIKNFSFKFDDGPYIFKTKGTVSFKEDIKVIPNNKEVTIIPGENSYKFPIIPGNFDLRFDISINNNLYTLCLPIPVFAYRFDFGEWQVEKPLAIWHSSFPKNISVIYPNDAITLKMENNNYDLEAEQFASYKFVKEKGYIDCDVIRFSSWFGRNETIRSVYLDLDDNNKNIEFINVITKSVLLSNLITYDPLKRLLMGRFEIAGYSNYYIDVEFAGKRIIDKQRIIDGKIEIKSTLNSGTYLIYIYEDEDDDSGFGDSAYQLVDKVFTELINPYDLQGKRLVLKSIKKDKSIFSLSLSKKYVIQDLKRVCKDDYNNYYGKLVIDGKHTENYVNVRFNDLRTLNYCFIYFKDEYEDEVEFLYDDYYKTIEYVEIEGLKISERYRRYDSIFEDDYFYVVEFLNENKNAKNARRTKIIKKFENESAITLD